MSESEETTTARSLMKVDFRTILADRPLREAMEDLVDFGDKRSPLPVAVVHADGSFAGLVTPLAVFKGLTRRVRTEDLDTLSEPELLAAMESQLDLPVAESMVREVPLAYPDDPLIALMKMNTERRLEFTPVLESDRVIGIIYVTDIFHAAASLALTHETEGIQLPPEQNRDISH